MKSCPFVVSHPFGLNLTCRALGDDEHKNLLLSLAMCCEGVICCRESPLQKALIEAADVGVDIYGEEGLQAVNSSEGATALYVIMSLVSRSALDWVCSSGSSSGCRSFTDPGRIIETEARERRLFPFSLAKYTVLMRSIRRGSDC